MPNLIDNPREQSSSADQKRLAVIEDLLLGEYGSWLNDWEISFLEDLKVKIKKGFTLTPKQYNKIVDIQEEVERRAAGSGRYTDYEETTRPGGTDIF